MAVCNGTVSCVISEKNAAFPPEIWSQQEAGLSIEEAASIIVKKKKKKLNPDFYILGCFKLNKY